MPESTTLENAGPNDQLVFSVVPKDENDNRLSDSGLMMDDDDPMFDESTGDGTAENPYESNALVEFSPEFYPDRFNKVMEKELNREGQQCRGEDVSVKSFKNADIHATGVCFAHQVPILEEIHRHEGKVDLYTPISPNGGLEAYVKKVEIGEKEGWNPHENEWMFKYTLDFVSTGLDEYGTDGENDVITSMLETK